MIDLTGEGPGTLYAIGAKAIGQAWMIGGVPGSNKMAVAMLNRVSCRDIAETWLLVDPDSRFKLSPSILSNFGLNFERDFDMAAELNISPTRETRHGVPARKLQIWSPKHSTENTIAICENNRS